MMQCGIDYIKKTQKIPLLDISWRLALNTHNLSKKVSVTCLACLVCLSCSMPAPQTADELSDFDATRALGLAVRKLPFCQCKARICAMFLLSYRDWITDGYLFWNPIKNYISTFCTCATSFQIFSGLVWRKINIKFLLASLETLKIVRKPHQPSMRGAYILFFVRMGANLADTFS